MQHVALDAGGHPVTSQEGDPRATATTPECPAPARGPAEPRHEADRAGRRDLGFPFAPVSKVGTRHRGGKAVDAGQLDFEARHPARVVRRVMRLLMFLRCSSTSSRCCNYNLYVQSVDGIRVGRDQEPDEPSASTASGSTPPGASSRGPWQRRPTVAGTTARTATSALAGWSPER